ncbi:MAG: carboxypeptidase regulatory-like domain-containing protein [Candidatus Poribacteria bacterium]|nr:carboxypeptidase regulatory-like domain-containing protein [Candidatus Poribacteria bacterium]MDE0502917.1 carboxypeptidase regulatory-like domain-containing protein [Candidatus Poribacteria bacterium]
MKTVMPLTTLSIFIFAASLTYAGTITGTVMYDGDAPARPKLTVSKDQHCIDSLKSAKSEALVVSKGKGIKNVVVYLRARGATPTTPAKNPVMDQIDCLYVPHVLVVTAGTTVDVQSSDPVAHNVHSHAKKNEAPNWQIPGPGKALPLKLEKREAIKFTCDIHNWMTGYIFVADNDYYAVTGYKDSNDKWIGSDSYEASSDTGGYSIKDVPAGKYRIQAWHEELGTTKAKAVEVAATGELKINFTNADFRKKSAK